MRASFMKLSLACALLASRAFAQWSNYATPGSYQRPSWSKRPLTQITGYVSRALPKLANSRSNESQIGWTFAPVTRFIVAPGGRQPRHSALEDCGGSEKRKTEEACVILCYRHDCSRQNS